MILRKRGQQESMSFLIGIIIFILIVTPIIIATAKYCKAETGMEKTLRLLVEKTEKLNDGENGSIIGNIGDNYVLMGFGKTGDFGSTPWDCGEGASENYMFMWTINRPKQCSDQACICMCEFSVLETLLTPGACENVACRVYNKDFDPKFFGGSECEYGPFIQSPSETIEINYQRAGENIGICREMPCISDDIDKARKVMESFHNSYLACKNNKEKDCLCEEFNFTSVGEEKISLPPKFKIRLNTDGETTTMTLLDPDKIIRGKRFIQKDSFGTYDPERNLALEVSEIDIGIDTDYEAYNYNGKSVQLFKSGSGFVSFVKSDENGFDKARTMKLQCQEKSTGEIKGRLALLDTTLTGGMVYSTLADWLKSEGRLQTFITKSVPEKNSWFESLYRDEDLNKDGSLKDEIFYIMLDKYTAVGNKRKVQDKDYIEIFYNPESGISKAFAEEAGKNLQALKGEKYHSELCMDEECIIDFDVIYTEGVGTGTSQEDIVFTACQGAYEKFITCEKEDSSKIPAIFIYVVDTEDGNRYDEEVQVMIGSEIFKATKAAFPKVQPKAEQEPSPGLNVT